MTSETVEVARIALRLPPFWKSNVRLWIAQCDHAFTFSGISSDDTKYSALVANLDAETLSYVSDIVLSPPNSDKYHTLLQRLITQFSDSETQKIKKLLTDLQLGDEKPSHLLRKMKELSNGQLQDDFLQSLCFQRMPPHIQTVLSTSSEPLDKLAIIADKVSEVVGASSTICAATSVPPPSQSPSCSAQPTIDSLARQIQELSLQVAELTRERNSSRHQRYSSDRRRTHSRSRSVNRGSGICYYHRRYKEQVCKCVSPCAFVQKKTNRKSGQKFLIDSGSAICVIPPSPTMNKSPQSNFSLFAANNTKISAYGMVRTELNLGLRRPFIWTFIIADVSSPIIGADFLKHFYLLIDLKKKATHPLSSATTKVVAKFKPKFEGPYRVLDVKYNNVVIWKAGKRLTINVDQVRIYRHRKCDETEIGTGNSDNGSLHDESSGFDRGQRRSNDSQDGKKKGLEVGRTRKEGSQKGSEHRVNKRALSSNYKTNDSLTKYRKKSRREETVTPTTSGYNLRPRIGKREESRPTMERKTQQGGPVRSRKGRERNDSPYIEERTSSSNKNARR
ncbi:transposon Ty3-I Gag-Pol polyprotein [Trichonephila clavipes]|nr:transposon Ty3-I Gag-Pol polyprotein [Trichonephila clavipes]